MTGGKKGILLHKTSVYRTLIQLQTRPRHHWFFLESITLPPCSFTCVLMGTELWNFFFLSLWDVGTRSYPSPAAQYPAQGLVQSLGLDQMCPSDPTSDVRIRVFPPRRKSAWTGHLAICSWQIVPGFRGTTLECTKQTPPRSPWDHTGRVHYAANTLRPGTDSKQESRCRNEIPFRTS